MAIIMAYVVHLAIQLSLDKRADKFNIDMITSHLENSPSWDVRSLSFDESQELNNALSQELIYLGKGKQCFAFRTLDDKYVLKLIKTKRLEIATWLKMLSWAPFFKDYYAKQSKRKTRRIHDLFTSYKIAFDDLKEETGLIYLHLNKTDSLNKIVKLTDKIGRQYLINLDDHKFCIQKKAKLVDLSIKERMALGDLNGAKYLIDQLLSLIVKRHQMGIIDYDPFLEHNSGFIGTQAIHIDIGRFSKNEIVKMPENSQQILKEMTRELRDKWLHLSYPELASYLDEQTEANFNHAQAPT